MKEAPEGGSCNKDCFVAFTFAPGAKFVALDKIIEISGFTAGGESIGMAFQAGPHLILLLTKQWVLKPKCPGFYRKIGG